MYYACITFDRRLHWRTLDAFEEYWQGGILMGYTTLTLSPKNPNPPDPMRIRIKYEPGDEEERPDDYHIDYTKNGVAPWTLWAAGELAGGFGGTDATDPNSIVTLRGGLAGPKAPNEPGKY